jgi:hypothetical protein
MNVDTTPTTAVPIKQGWTEALALVDFKTDAEPRSTWMRSAQGVEWRANEGAPTYAGTFKLPVNVGLNVGPSYAVEVEFTPGAAGESLGIVLPIGERRVTAAWFFRDFAGIGKVDGKDPQEAGEPEKSSAFALAANRRYTARVEVRHAPDALDIRFVVDGRIVGAYRGTGERLTLSTHFHLLGGPITCPMLGANNRCVFHRASVTALGDLKVGEKAPPPVAGPAPAAAVPAR